MAPRRGSLPASRRRLIALLGGTAGAAVLFGASRLARAQSYPARPVRIVVGFAPGGPNDINARLIGQWLSERLGQQFIVDNRPGASGNIAMESVVKSPPDGYTLVMVATSSAVNATLYDKLPFVCLRDIAPIGTISRGPTRGTSRAPARMATKMSAASMGRNASPVWIGVNASIPVR